MNSLMGLFEHREKIFKSSSSAVKFPNEHPFVQGLKKLIPMEFRTNYQMAIFSVGKDQWGRECEVAVYFMDFSTYIGNIDDIVDYDGNNK